MCGYHFELYEDHPDRWDDKIDPDGYEFCLGHENTLEEAREVLIKVSLENPTKKYFLQDWDCGGPCNTEEHYRNGKKEPEWPGVSSVHRIGRTMRSRRMVPVDYYTKMREIIKMSASDNEEAVREAQKFLANEAAEKFDQKVLPKDEYYAMLEQIEGLKEQVESVKKLLNIAANDENISEFQEELKEQIAKWQETLDKKQ